MRVVTNQFLSNARLYSSVLSDRLKCSSVLLGSDWSRKSIQQFSQVTWLLCRDSQESFVKLLHVSEIKPMNCSLQVQHLNPLTAMCRVYPAQQVHQLPDISGDICLDYIGTWRQEYFVSGVYNF